MGTILSIVIAVAFAILQGFLTSNKKSRVSVSEGDDSQEFESWMNDAEEDFESLEDEPEGGYFTYEDVSATAPIQEIEKELFAEEEQKTDENVVIEQEPEAIAFDLRQAIIYQTILQNDYISEMK